MRQGELPRSEPAEDGNRDQRCKADHRGPTERQFAKSRPAEFSTIGLPLKSVKAFHDEVRSARQTTGPRKSSIAKLFHCLNYPAGLELHGLSRASPRISSRGSAPHWHAAKLALTAPAAATPRCLLCCAKVSVVLPQPRREREIPPPYDQFRLRRSVGAL